MDQAIQERPVIAMDAVESSQIAFLGHDAAENVLTIQFSKRADGTPGSIYRYQNVDSKLFGELKNSESVGSFFYKHIKPFAEKYPYKKIEPGEFTVTRFSSTTFKDNGDPIMLNADGTRSVFCDVDE